MSAIKELYKEVISYFETHVPIAETELNFRNTFELLVAVILSAQCTDKRVNITTSSLFKIYPDVETLSLATVEEVYESIKSISYPNNKAKSLVAMAKQLMLLHNGNVPEDWDELIKLPGVGRKTANVIVSVAFDKPAIAVDTHVFRVTQRIGLVKPSKTPLEVEKQLVKYVPEKLHGKFHHWIILHGRYVCTARNPKHSECGLRELCRYYKQMHN